MDMDWLKLGTRSHPIAPSNEVSWRKDKESGGLLRAAPPHLPFPISFCLNWNFFFWLILMYLVK